MLPTLSGCKKSSDEPTEPPVKTIADYEAEAEKEITPETMEAELEKLEKEIDADLKSGG
jgi:hypothetical protein